MRVVDAGDCDAWRSQALWHGIASAMAEDSPPTLSFCRPAEPYVGLGFHRSLAELDRETCRRLGLPIIRRRIGGGPVYIDDQQLFFQLTLPAAAAPARVDLLYSRFLAPAVAAFRSLGLNAELRGLNDIAVADRKISGTGAGRIGEGVVVVGNVIFGFPHERMLEVLAFDSDSARQECRRLLRRHVSSLAGEQLTTVGREDARRALISSYAAALGLAHEPGLLTAAEELAIDRWRHRFREPAWLAGPQLPRRPGRQIKISADAWLWLTRDESFSLEASVARGFLERLHVEGPRLNGTGELIARAIGGLPAKPGPIAAALALHGAAGEHIARLLIPGLTMS